MSIRPAMSEPSIVFFGLKKPYLITQEAKLAKFDEELFRRFVEKVIVQSMAEVAFLFKVGVEVREIL